ncbi:hypothetical protein CFK39_15490 (plasmid) [Brachybacterium avium]|uniref:Uncharacterized protein n=1 Tax=Brachybacterium avium TaxID=2017485 RepID=A0A220UGJ7_9MICO|nr:hypothetical protein [Brachybacterium avium]ASK67249.1 hypothetical protein CFK39_15490 [Brachybacterium avium]
MIKLLHTDNPDGGSVPVVVDSDHGGLRISRFELSRGVVEGASGAFEAEAFFDTSTVSLEDAVEFDIYVWVNVLTENWNARMMDYKTIRQLEDLEPSWDFATPSVGDGPVHAVHVKTSVQPIL